MAKRKLPKDERALSTRGPDQGSGGKAAYEVGNCKPPKEHQFKPGQSGNPKGRPPGSKNKTVRLERIDKMRIEEAHREVELNGESLTMVRLADRAMWAKAAKGSERAYREANRVLAAALSRHDLAWKERLNIFAGYKYGWLEELEARENGQSQATHEPLPHPDHIVIDEEKQLAIVAGPMNQAEKRAWNETYAEIQEFRREIEASVAQATETSDPEFAAGLLHDALLYRWRIAMLAVVLNLRWHRAPEEVMVPKEEDYMLEAIYAALEASDYKPENLNLELVFEAWAADQSDSNVFEDSMYFKHNGYRYVPRELAIRLRSRLAKDERHRQSSDNI